MKLLLIALAAFLFFPGTSALAQKTDTGETFIGEIINSQCVPRNATVTQAEINGCEKNSAERNGNYVLYDPESKTTYELVDQKKAAEFVGRHVMLTGYVDVSSRAIHISDIIPHS